MNQLSHTLNTPVKGKTVTAMNVVYALKYGSGLVLVFPIELYYIIQILLNTSSYFEKLC